MWQPFFIHAVIDGRNTSDSRVCALKSSARLVATVQVLAINDGRRLEIRQEILKHGDLT
jgi:hypothetical protein